MSRWDINLMYSTTMYIQTIFWRSRFIHVIHVGVKSTKVSIFMPISSERASISPWKHSKSIPIRTCVCKAVQQLFVKYLIKQLNTFSICKYAKTVHYWSTFALVDGSLESRTPC